MTSMIVSIADAVVQELNVEFSMDFSAVRTYRPQYEIKDLGDLQVSVVPRSMSEVPSGRNMTTRDDQIDIGIHKHIESDEELDGLMDLVQEVADFCIGRRFADAQCVRAENNPIWSQEHLKSNVFLSLITLQVKYLRTGLRKE